MKRFAALLFFVGVSAWARVPYGSNWFMPLRTPSAGFVFPYEATQPLLKKDILYVADQQGRVLAIQRNLGFVLWETKVPGGVLGALAYGRSKLFVGNRNGDLLALNARDGSESWRFTSASKWLAVPAVSKMYNQVFARTSAGTLYALSETKGDLLWSYPNASDKKMTIWGSGGPTLFRDSEIFQGFDDGTLVALKAENGQLIWQKKLGLNPTPKAKIRKKWEIGRPENLKK
jgi:outer membrane protein assembly factor BamB